jgi:hypothetical protein
LPAPWYSKAKIAEAHFYLTVKNDYVHTLELCRLAEALITEQKADQFYANIVFSIQASCYQHLGELDKAEEHTI